MDIVFLLQGFVNFANINGFLKADNKFTFGFFWPSFARVELGDFTKIKISAAIPDDKGRADIKLRRERKYRRKN
jgi:hypothetical protein